MKADFQRPAFLKVLFIAVFGGIGFSFWVWNPLALIAAPGIDAPFHMRVSGPSMLPLLRDGQSIEVQPVTEDCSELQVEDVVVFRHEASQHPLVKRIYGVPGDEIVLNHPQRQLVINANLVTNLRGQPFRVRHEHWEKISRSLDSDSRVIANSYIVLGENGHIVFDSRVLGGVSCWHILGKVLPESGTAYPSALDLMLQNWISEVLHLSDAHETTKPE